MLRTLLITALLPCTALAAEGDLVQPPELAAPQRGSLRGAYAGAMPAAASLARGAFELPSPLSAPSERGALLAPIFPSYTPDAGQSEWGMGWRQGLSLRRWRVAGDPDFATDDLDGPWGRMVRGDDGAFYPIGLRAMVRVTLDSSGAMVAHLPDGSVWTFALGVDVSGRGRYAWYLTEARDVGGRRTVLTWTPNLSGRPFLSRVDWGGVSGDPQYRIEIAYEPLPSALPFVDFSSGRELDLDQRVHTVAVSARDASGAFAARWEHRLAYQQEPVGAAFYLTEIDTVFASGEAMPPVRYSYAFASDRLGAAAFAPLPALDPVLARFGADVVGAETATLFDADRDGRADLEEHTTNALVHHGDAGFDIVPLPPPAAGALAVCRPAAFSPTPELVPPRTLVRMRPADDADHVLAFSFDPGAFQTRVDVCTREGDPLAHRVVAGDWTPSPTVRVVDVNRDHQPDLVAIGAGQYDIVENDGAGFGVHHTGTLEPVTFQPAALWVLDMNGDGIADLIARDDSGFLVWFGKGNFEFEAQGQSFDVRTTSGMTLPSLDGYGFAFVDANRDGLTDLLLTQGGAISLFVSTGSYFQQLAVPALDGLGPDASFPLIGDLAGSGNTEIAIVAGGHAQSLALDAPETGLLVSADDGRGTVLRYSYARGPAAPDGGARPPLLGHVEVTETGVADTAYDYSFANPHAHSLGRFLLGYDHVVRAGGGAQTGADFENGDAIAALPVRESETSAPELTRVDAREFTITTFRGVPWAQPLRQTRSWLAPGDGSAIAETTEQSGWVGACSLTTRKTGAAGTLQIDRTVYALPALADHLMCPTEWSTLTGRHADTRLDFVQREHSLRNDIGLVTRTDSVGADGSVWTRQQVTYGSGGLPAEIAVPGRGSTRFDWDLARGLLVRITAPDGVVTEAGARDGRTDAVSLLTVHHGNAAWNRSFAFDGLERLAAAWDDVAGGTAADPLEQTGYRYASGLLPGAVSLVRRVDAGAHAQTAELETGGGDALASFARIPEGWISGPIALRTPAANQVDRYLAGAAIADPLAVDTGSLAGGATQLASTQGSSFGIEVASWAMLERGIVRRVRASVAASAGLLARAAVENDSFTSTTFTDAAGKPWAYVDAGGTRYGYQYDALGRLRDVALPDGTHHRVDYDDHGRIGRIARDGVVTIERSYDPASGLVTFETELDATGEPTRRVSWTYDAAGRPTAETLLELATAANATFHFSYDQPGWLTGVDGPGFSKRFSYRADGKLASASVDIAGWRTLTTRFDYHDDGTLRGRTISALDGSGQMVDEVALGYPVDALGRPQGVTLAGRPLAQAGYDPRSLPTSVTLAGANLAIDHDPQTRAEIGLRESMAGASLAYAVHRNARGLVDAEAFDFGAAGVINRSYAYAAAGFLVAGGAFGYEYDAFGLPTAISDGVTRRTIARSGNTLTAGNSVYEFDTRGRVIRRDDLELAYGPDGQLASASRGSASFHFVSDESGNRLAKLGAQGPIAAYDGDVYLDAGGLTVPIEVAGQLVAVVQRGAVRPLIADPRGTPVAGTDGGVSLPSPYGARAEHPDVAAAIDYVRSRWDADLGLARMGVRDYDPALGRFLQPDPLLVANPSKCVAQPDACNLYGYARSNPLAFADASGREPQLNSMSTHWATLGAGEYELRTRIYAPFQTFGGGFEGDNRGVSTRVDVSSRIVQSTTFDLSTGDSLSHAWSDQSRGAGFIPRAMGLTAGIGLNKPLERFSHPNFSSTLTRESFGFELQQHVDGKMPMAASAVTPAIDLTTDLHMAVVNQSLYIYGTVRFDGFPNYEMLLRDHADNVLVIRNYATREGPYGPLYMLPGDFGPNELMSIKIHLDADGNFKDVESHGRSYTPDEWNHQFVGVGGPP